MIGVNVCSEDEPGRFEAHDREDWDAMDDQLYAIVMGWAN